MKDDAHVVLDQHDGELAVAMQPANELGDLVGLLVAHAGRGLVKQQEMRLERQCHGDLGGALIAVGELADQAVGLGFQSHELERLRHPALDVVALGAAHPRAQAIAARDLGADAYIL